jgi:hypothetical protein
LQPWDRGKRFGGVNTSGVKMLIEIKGKFFSNELQGIAEAISAYFKKHGIEEFVEIDIDLKPFDKTLKLPVSLSDESGKEIRSIEIIKLKSGELKIKEKALDNTWMTETLGTQSPGDLLLRIWPLYVIVSGVIFLFYYLNQ